MKKRVSILGATGSIGHSALDVISRDREHFGVVLLSANSKRDELEKIARDWPGCLSVITGAENGKEKLISAICSVNADITLNGISGAAGLLPSLAAIDSRSSLALANKETIVMAGELVLRRAKEKNVNIIPVDSEHSAIFHLLNAVGEAEEITLTASGGPFRKTGIEELKNVNANDALAHPTWKMGPKITIDSATMANKGLEIIEAASLFNMPPDKIRVVIHPQSIVHSMIKLSNGVFYAQMSKPDMRHPIHDALYWPLKTKSSFETLDFSSLTLEFEKPDLQKFPMLKLARNAAMSGGLYPCVYNAANETAVKAFMEDRIGFLEIADLTEYVLSKDWKKDSRNDPELEEILTADTDARKNAEKFVRQKGKR
ncbi:MAG: 1-deoxy-D-xylulose-5-phosphate reductoisomerase [Treponema sp.]|jgi:1-deoxy-D-xylulose-5-phosphate reductoisomerase|nr:1-deoxy-D-xylulose-5-phosphate reductoisomerase [Treponema sp.]